MCCLNKTINNILQILYLINSYNIAKVVSVNINDDNTASIVAIIIPKRIYDEYYSNVNNQNRIR